jgi:hypothetical protein
LFRRRRPLVPLEIIDGFEAAEGRALQRSLTAALRADERAARRDVPTVLEIGPGSGDVLVVIWRNLVVGFVPPDEAMRLRQLLPTPPVALTIRGVVRWDGGLWRVWVGDPPDEGFPASTPHHDTLPEPEDTLLGIPLRRRSSHESVWPKDDR